MEEREEKEEQKKEEQEKEGQEKDKETEEEEKKEKEEEEEEIPSTAGEKKRGNDEASPDSPPAKKLCTEETGETSNVPCEVSSTSLHTSNGSSTSTKPAAMEESEAAVSEDDLLALAEKAAEAEAAEKEASKEAEQQLEKEQEKVQEEVEEEEEESKTSEAVAAEEEAVAAEAEETAVEDDGDMASKLAASGISVSLIKKKKALSKDGSSTGDPAKEKISDEKQDGAVEIGPNISVTMIQKEKNSEKKTARSPGLSIKSPGELMEAPRRVSAQLEDLKDSISVSQVHRTPVSASSSTPSTPRLPNLAPQ